MGGLSPTWSKTILCIVVMLTDILFNRQLSWTVTRDWGTASYATEQELMPVQGGSRDFEDVPDEGAGGTTVPGTSAAAGVAGAAGVAAAEPECVQPRMSYAILDTPALFFA